MIQDQKDDSSSPPSLSPASTGTETSVNLTTTIEASPEEEFSPVCEIIDETTVYTFESRKNGDIKVQPLKPSNLPLGPPYITEEPIVAELVCALASGVKHGCQTMFPYVVAAANIAADTLSTAAGKGIDLALQAAVQSGEAAKALQQRRRSQV